MNSRLKKIIQHAHQNSPAFKQRLEDAGCGPADFEDIPDLEKIPVLRKETLVDLQATNLPFGGLLGVDVSQLQRIFQSPGPIYDPQGNAPDYWRWGEALKIAGFGPGDIVINTFSYHLSPAGFMFDDGLRSVGATVVPTGVGNTELQVKIVSDLKANGYLGTPSFLGIILDKAIEMEKEISIRKAFVGGEPFFPAQQHRFREAGIDVYQGYGTADAGAIAFECETKKGLHISQDMILEIADPNTGAQLPPGEIGEIVVTLFDETYPLIRFGTGDLSKVMTEACRCTLGTPRLAGYLGRIGDAVKVRGMFVHARQISDVLSKFPATANFSAIVSRESGRDFLRMTIESTETSENFANQLQSRLKAVIRVSVDEINFVGPGTLTSGSSIKDDRNLA